MPELRVVTSFTIDREPNGLAVVRDPRGDMVVRQVPLEASRASSPCLCGVLTRVEVDGPGWMPAARAAFAAAIEPWGGLAATGRAAVWPDAAGVISDIPSTLTFLRTNPSWGLILEPAALLTPSMLDRAEEHVERMAEALATHPALRGVIQAAASAGATVRLNDLVSRVVLPRLRAGVWVAQAPVGGAYTPGA